VTEIIIRFVVSFVSGVGGGALIVWYLKERIKTGHSKELEEHKSALAKDVERLKGELAHESALKVERVKAEHAHGSALQVERLKAELSLQTALRVEQYRAELAKHQHAEERKKVDHSLEGSLRVETTLSGELAMQQEARRLALTKKHDIYPKLMQAIRRVEGVVLSPAVTGTGYLPVYTGLSAAELRKVLVDARIPEGDIGATLELFEHSPNEGVKEVEKLVRKRSISDARHTLEQERNYFILERTSMSDPVQDLASAVFRTLSDALVDLTSHFDYPDFDFLKSFRANEKKSGVEIVQLEKLVRQELQP
jgi:hypothetical protein